MQEITVLVIQVEDISLDKYRELETEVKRILPTAKIKFRYADIEKVREENPTAEMKWPC